MDDKLNVEEGGLGINIEPKEKVEIEDTLEVQKAIEELNKKAEELPEDEEEKELTDEEKKELYIKQLKDARKQFYPIKHDGNITTNQFGTKFKQHRKRKNTLTKQSRRANRRK